jgi:hypothetical protein
VIPYRKIYIKGLKRFLLLFLLFTFATISTFWHGFPSGILPWLGFLFGVIVCVPVMGLQVWIAIRGWCHREDALCATCHNLLL